MKTLQELLSAVNCNVIGRTDISITGMTLDSREVKPGYLFVAVKGSISDGHTFIPKAIENGAVAILCETTPPFSDITILQSDDARQAAGLMASAFYDHPSKKLKLAGVTGTNGKTTVATLMYRLFTALGNRCGLLSTVENVIDSEIIPATHTTPDPIRLNELLARMVDKGCDYCFMEVSSHAIHQERIAGLDFDLGIFTNITHDHLDYHHTFDAYLAAKRKFFDDLKPEASALTNRDDRNGQVMLQNTRATRYTYALHHVADFQAKIIEHDFGGMLLKIGKHEAWFRLVGKFNAYNLLAAYASAFIFGIDEDQIITTLTSIPAVSGRFEYLKTPNGVIGIVDYAHTPDALQNVLETINAIRSKNEQLITIVGCGGNRDHEKRPVMAAVSCKESDRVILTSDNPRNESPEAILSDMMTGVKPQDFKKVLKIHDRAEAIKTALTLANKGDIILIAGKGHEKYQEIKGVRHPFDDVAVFTETAQKMN